jgi:hypothetical protein
LRFFEKDLRVRIAVSFVILVLVGSVAASVISYTLVNKIVRDNIESSMLDSARMTTNLLQVALERRETRMALLANYPVLRDPAAGTDAKTAALALFVDTWPIGEGAVMLDTNGNVTCATGSLATLGNVSETDWFKNAQTAHVALTYVHDPAELSMLSYDSPTLAVSTAIRTPATRSMPT